MGLMDKLAFESYRLERDRQNRHIGSSLPVDEAQMGSEATQQYLPGDNVVLEPKPADQHPPAFADAPSLPTSQASDRSVQELLGSGTNSSEGRKDGRPENAHQPLSAVERRAHIAALRSKLFFRRRLYERLSWRSPASPED